MIVRFAFTNDARYEYDIATGLLDPGYPITEFEMDIAMVTPLNSESASPFQSKLLDGNRWELPVKETQKQTIVTLPNLVLAGLKMRIETVERFYTYKELLRLWNYALSRWVQTDELAGSSADSGYVKVVRGTESLDFEQVNGLSFAQRTVLNVVPAAAQ